MLGSDVDLFLERKIQNIPRIKFRFHSKLKEMLENCPNILRSVQHTLGILEMRVLPR